MVIDRPRFYFKANKIKRWLALIALLSFICSLVTYQFSIQASGVFVLITILAVIIYVILWFVT